MIEIERTLNIQERCELMSYIDKKAKEVIESKSLQKKSEEVYKDIYEMAIRQTGAFSLESAEAKYLKAIHSEIFNYRLPAYLEN